MPIDKETAAASVCENEESKTVGIFGERIHNGTESATAGQKDILVDKKGVTWPGWETVRLIGRGSFGTVYEIQRDVLGNTEKAALKAISIPQNASDIDEMYSNGYDQESITSTFKSHLKSIVAEYSMMRQLSDCPNIVSCDDVRYIQHDDGIGWDIYIKMELLTPLLKSFQGPVSEETIIKLAKDICSALVVCKQHNIIHRDIKPQNIFLAPSGIYKLGDFGIAKTVEKTMGGTKIGTYNYMAPEVYNNKPYGNAADIYSLGLVLYWLLNERRMPFLPLPPEKLGMGMDEAARNRRLSGERFAEPKNGSEELKAIVMKACAYNVEDRYASASEMLADLNRIKAKEDGNRMGGLFYTQGTKPAIFAAVAVLLLILVLAIQPGAGGNSEGNHSEFQNQGSQIVETQELYQPALSGPREYTYDIVYRSSNGSNLGTATAEYEYGTTNTITPPVFSGYNPPAEQIVEWDSTSTKTITFIYTPAEVSNATQSGYIYNKPVNSLSYSADVEYQNRTATSIQLRVVWTTSLSGTKVYNAYGQRFTATVGSVDTGPVVITNYGAWKKESSSTRSATVCSDWITVPLSTTNATTLNMRIYYYQVNRNGKDMTQDGISSLTTTWTINIPAY